MADELTIEQKYRRLLEAATDVLNAWEKAGDDSEQIKVLQPELNNLFDLCEP